MLLPEITPDAVMLPVAEMFPLTDKSPSIATLPLNFMFCEVNSALEPLKVIVVPEIVKVIVGADRAIFVLDVISTLCDPETETLSLPETVIFFEVAEISSGA